MSLSRHTSRIYMDDFDVNCTLNILAKRIAEEPNEEGTPYYIGAHMILNFIYSHEDIRDQSVLLQLFDNQLMDNGIRPYDMEGEKKDAR